MKKLAIFLVLFLYSLCLIGQDETGNKSDTLRKDALNVYMSASSYMKTEIPFINYVRDRKVADLVVIDTYQTTGSGGSEYTYYIEGQNRFAGMMDTLKFNTSPDDTQDQVRSKEVKTLKMGLMRYVIKTPLADYFSIRFSEPLSDKVTTDKWNSWVFRTGLNGSISGQKTYGSQRIGANISASKVTSDWKINFRASYSNSYSEYDYGEIKTEHRRKSSNANILIVKSLTDHWSIGGSSRVFNSIFSNYDLGFSVEPGIEYDIYPYSESTRRQLRILYTVGLNFNNYVDTTQFFKTKEYLWSQNVQASYTTIQKWGYISVSSTWRNYLHDFSLNNLSLDCYLNLKIAKGLSIKLGGSYMFIHDQVSLRKGEASIEDVLLHRQELSTSYSYYTSFGISYTFGSIYNNAVNPRFSQSMGGMMMMY